MGRIDSILTSLSDRYRVQGPLAGGGMAPVFLAIDRKHQRRVALKFLDPERTGAIDAERFLREIRITAGLQHPHILPLLDSGSEDGVPYFVTPYVEGESLAAKLEREKRLSLEEVVALTRDLAGALDAAHEHGVVHRDIKPANILLSGGQAVVADFGVARATGGGDRKLTQSGSTVGTPLYMSPEQVGGSQEVDGRADQYALGCVVFEMLTGIPPFHGSTADAIAYQHLAVPAPPVVNLRPGLPSGVGEAIARALAKVPADRHPSAGAFAHSLAEATISRPSLEPAIGTAGVPQTHTLRGGALWPKLALVSVLVLATAVATWTLWGRRFASAPVRTLAVLPLENLTGDQDQLYFADGMTEELISEISKVGSIRVSARSAVMRYRSTRTPLRTVARELHVDALVEGSVSRDGDRVRVTARLIDPATEQERWSQQYERESGSILALQAEVAQAVAVQLKARLTPAERTRLASPAQVNPRAHEAVLRGFYLLDRIDGANYRKAIAHFEEALRIDPAYSVAWAGLADTYYYLSSIYLPANEAMPRARAAAQHALEIDRSLAAAHATLAMVRAQYDGDWKGADSSFRAAIALNPSLARAHAYYSLVLSQAHRFDESMSEAEKAIALDPLSTFYATGLGMPLLYSRRFDEAIAVYSDVIRRDSTYGIPRAMVAQAYSAIGRHDQAVEEARRGAILSDGPFALATLGYVYGRAGRVREAREVLDRLLHHETGRVQGSYLARIYASLGRRNDAIAELERSIREHEEDVLLSAVDPAMDPLRGDPRFRDLLKRVNLKP